MIEDELRTLLADRAGEVEDDNARRVTEVRSRIGAVRRRRTAATTLALVLVVAAGVLVTQLPGAPRTLPAGAPPGPYFTSGAEPVSVRGYHGGQYFTFSGDSTWYTAPVDASRTVVVARCEHRGDLVLRDGAGAGPELRLSCRVPVGDHWEGARPLDAAQTRTILGATSSGAAVTVRPSSAGLWSVGVLEPLYPDAISRQQVRQYFNGFDHPAGGPYRITVPGTLGDAHGFGISVYCVQDVRLEFRVSGRLLATAACSGDATAVQSGGMSVFVPERTATALGLRPGRPATLDVRSTGRQTGQWALLGVG